MKKRVGIIVVMLALVLIFCQTVAAEENTTGNQISVNNDSKIQDAINNASSGDTIIVNPGTYNENIVLNKTNLTLKANGSVTINASNVNNPGFYVNNLGNNSWIEGFTITGATGSSGIYLSGASNCVIYANIISSNRYGIYLDSSNNNQILNNTITGTSGYGISITGLNATVSGNNVTGTGNAGIVINSANTTVTGNTVASNGHSGWSGWTQDGISVTGVNPIVSGNTVTGNRGTGISVNGNNAQILQNILFQNGGYGIGLTSVNATVINNNATDNGNAGMKINGDGVIVSNNTVVSNGHRGWSGWTQDGININGNNAIITPDNVICDNRGTGLYVSGNNITLSGFTIYNNGGYGIYVVGTNSTAINNNVTNNGNAGIIVNSNDITVSGNTVTSNGHRGWSGWNQDGISVTGANVTVSGNTVTGNRGTGISVNGNNAQILQNVLFQNGGYGISAGINATIINNNMTDNGNAGMKINGDGVIVSNNTVVSNGHRGWSGWTQDGISVTGNNAIITSDNVIHDNWGTGLSVNGNNIVLTGLTIYNNGGYGIYVVGTNSTAINNNVTNNGNAGIIVNSAGVTVSGNNITGNGKRGFSGWNWDGLSVTGANVTVSGNIVVNNGNNGGNGISVNGDNAIITPDNVIHDNSRTGLYVRGNNITLNGFTIYNNGGYGIDIAGTNSTAINNNVADNGNAGIMVNSAGVTISGNTVTSNGNRGFSYWSWDGIGVTGFNVTVINNNVTGNSRTGISVTGNNAQILQNSLIQNGGYGINAAGVNSTVINNTVFNNGNAGIVVNGDNATISNNTATSNGNRGFSYWSWNGIDVTGNNAIITPDNVIHDNSRTGLYVRGNNITLYGFNLYNNGGYGLDAAGLNLTVINNNVADNGNAGMVINGDGVIVSGNTVINNGYRGFSYWSWDGISVTGNNAIITPDNVIHDNSRAGLYVRGNNITLNGFNIYNNGGYGIDIAGTNSTVINNIVTNNSNAGIVINGVNAFVSGNTVTINGNRGFSYWSWDGISVTGVNAVVSGNIATGNGRAGVSVNGDNSQVLLNSIIQNGGYGINVAGLNVTVVNNMVNNNSNAGIVTSGDYGTVSSNAVTNNGYRGFGGWSWDGIYIRGNNVQTLQNSIDHNNEYGINAAGLNLTISENSVTSNGRDGINVNGANSTISGNNATGNSLAGVYVTGTDAIVSENTATNNQYGIYFNSASGTARGNNLTGNQYGIYLSSSSANVNFNRIIGNSRYGLYNTGNGIVNATNNWWGSNNGPVISSTTGSDIYIINGNVTYNPWLILNITTPSTNGNSTITAVVIHNNTGEDTSSQGHIPDDIPINFVTNVGTIITPAYTRNGKANAALNCGTVTSGIVTITAILDNQTVQTSIPIDTIAPTVTVSPPGGIYNNYQNVTLTATDDFDSNPVVYYSIDNGVTWNSQANTVTVDLSLGEAELEKDLMFYAVDAAGNPSDIVTATYTIDAEALVIIVNQFGGIYNTSQIVNLTISSDSNATIYYTIDGSDPQTSSTKNIYTTPINITTTTTLRFSAVSPVGNWGPNYTETYIIDTTAPAVTANIPGGVYNTTQTVTLTATDNVDQNPIIYYTLDGSDPTTSSTRYTGPITISMDNTTRTTTTLKFIAIDQVGNLAQVQTENYTLTLPVVNIYTDKCYSSIQDAINDSSTLNGHTIELYSGTYTENVIVNKSLTIMPVEGQNVIIQALNPLKPVFTITSLGNGTIIQGFTITGATNSSGIYLNGTSACDINGNNLTNSNYGVYSDSGTSMSNVIDNNLTNNNYGIYLSGSDYGLIQNNNVTSSIYGIYISNSDTNLIFSNNIRNNQYGIYLSNSSAGISFNMIVGNSLYGLYTTGNGTVNAANNWWGSNNPVISSINGSDIYVAEGIVEYDPWLILSINSSTTISQGHASSFDIVADLNHNNQGEDTSSSGSVPDGIPIYFNTTLGTINGSVSTRSGRAVANLDYGSLQGTANVSATLDNQTVSTIQKVYYSIQAAIDDPLTVNGSIVEIGSGTYIENIVVNKRITLRPVSGDNVTIQAADPSKPTITVNSDGNGSTIQGFNITGGSAGVLLDLVDSCDIANNNITNNYYGIQINNSTSAGISGNNIMNNTGSGIYLNSSNSAYIFENSLTGNGNGIQLSYSNNNNISGNDIINNTGSGIYSYYSDNGAITGNNILNNLNDGIYLSYSSANIKFNRIVGNSLCGFYNEGNSTVNATNNWWGSNNPVISSINGSDIYVSSGIVNYDSWIVLTTNIFCDRSNRTGITYNYIIRVDLVHNNHGDDTSSSGNISDGVLVYFNSTLGTVSSPLSTINGKIVSILNSTTPGLANVSITLDNQTIFKTVDILGVDVLGVHNERTHEDFSTIQAAIDDADTLNNDIITLDDGIYTENVIVNKKLTLKPVSGANVIIQALDELEPVFTVNSPGNGTIIQGLTIIGTTSSIGIYLNGTSNCNITGNNLTDNAYGIYLLNSSYTIIQNNVLPGNMYGIYLLNSNNNAITNNTAADNYQGVYLSNGSSNTLSGNDILSNQNGIYLSNSTNNIISGNTVVNNFNGIYLYINSNNNQIKNNNVINNQRGIYLYNTAGSVVLSNIIKNNQYGIYSSNSSVNINFNIIAGNSRYGLYTAVNGTVNAVNNWWGSNNPVVSSSSGSDIYVAGGTVNYNPWLVLNITANPASTNSNSTITADLTHNNAGGDTSSSGHIPDDIPVNFITNLGTVTSPVYTRNGKAGTTFDRGTLTSGIANITVTFDKQTVQANVTIDITAPTVTANLPGGIYNTVKSVTLNAADDLDANPVIYYSVNNGATWTSQAKTATLSLGQGITNLMFYVRDLAGNNGTIQNITYTIDTTAPTVTTSLASGSYNTIQVVTLNATDNMDSNPVIYYSVDDGVTWSNQVKTVTLTFNPGKTDLMFYAGDFAGKNSTIQTRNYTIDMTMPTITANLAGGIYNTTKSVTLNATDNFDANPVIYYSVDNGVTWSNQVKTVTLNLNPGITDLIFYARDVAGNNGTIQNVTYTIDTTAPVVTVSLVNGSYNTYQNVTLNATDNFDANPVIYYTLDGSEPTALSTIYTGPINIITRNVILKFIAVDAMGNSAPVQTVNYTINLPVHNINTGNVYYTIQDAINDVYTINGHTIEIKNGTYAENIVVNKIITLRPFYGESVTLQPLNPSNPIVTINSGGSGSVIQGFNITGGSHGIYLNSVNYCNITGNIVTNNYYSGIGLENSNYNIIYGNTALNNTHYSGISLESSNNNVIQNNTAIGNYWGISLYYYSNNNTISGNTLTNNLEVGIELANSLNNTVLENTIANNTYDGIVIQTSNNNTIHNNTVTGHRLNEIAVFNSSNCIVSGNTVSNSINYYGIYLVNSNNNILSENIVTNNTSSGIKLESSNDNTIQNNTVKNNWQGIYIISSVNNTLSGNLVTNNTFEGIKLYISNNSVIQNNTITGNQYGVQLSSSIYSGSDNNNIWNNIVTDNDNGIYVSGSDNNVQNNTVMRNEQYGIFLASSLNSIVSGNSVINNIYPGILLSSSDNALIQNNIIANNCHGIYLYSSTANINFNRIVGNTFYGLYNDLNSTVNATNNWWGSNNPIVNSVTRSDIYIATGTVNYNPWLVLNITAVDGNATVTADLTHNSNGEDTSSSGHVPDDLPVNFTTNLGVITSPGYTKDGKASATFNRGTATEGIANITATLDNQTVQTNMIIDTIAPTITVNVVGGIYNTAKSVTLNATDNMDSDPVIYYSVDNGVTWNNQTNTVTLTFNQGITNLMFYAGDAIGNMGLTQTASYIIDTTAPDVTANLPSGNYNITQVVTLNATDNLDINPVIYYSLDNGVTWNNQTNTVTLTLNDGVTDLIFYAVDAAGNVGLTQTATYIIDTTAPDVTANLASGVYNTIQIVNLTVTDNMDVSPVIYYTTDGSDPTTSSKVYTSPINIVTRNAILKFMAVDWMGNQAQIQILNYTINLPIININTDKVYSSIQDAITDVSTINGHVIEIESGNYIENIVLNKKLTLRSVYGECVIILAANTSNPVITINSDGSGSLIQSFNITGGFYGIYLNSNNCNITGNIITNTTGYGSFGVYILGSNNTVQNNTITNGVSGIMISAGSNNTIQNNTVKNNSYEGIYLSGSNYNIIRNNTIENNSFGIGGLSSNNIIQNNTVKNNGAGIGFTGSNNTIQNNIITNNAGAGITIHGSSSTISSNNTVQNNIIANNTGYGIDIYYNTYYITIQNNIIANNTGYGGYGIDISNSDYNTIQNNTIIDNSGYGIHLYNSNGNTIFGNTISNDRYGIYLQDSSANVHFNRIVGNSVYSLYNSGNGVVNATNNWWGSNNPIVSSTIGSDIYIASGTVTYDPWLIFNATVDTNVISSQNSDQNPVITVDMTHNSNGEDTSSQGHIPDNIPVNFATDLGSITGTVYTRNGKANVTFNRGNITEGISNITATLDNQTLQTNITIDTIAPTVIVNVIGGVYNTTQIINLTVTDNFDPNPVIYYTLDGSDPTTSSAIYTGPITLIMDPVFRTITNLRFMAIDQIGNLAQVQNETYILTLPVVNANNSRYYSMVQDAINDVLTMNGHVIEIYSGIFVENVLVNKIITIRPVTGENVTIQAENPNNSVITINSAGSGSTIQGLTITGATGSYGLNINSNCNVTENIISNNSNGIYVGGNNAVISGNTLTGNSGDGIIVYGSNVQVLQNFAVNNGGNGIRLNDGNWGHATYSNATIINNTLTGNSNGIVVNCVNDVTISGNTATGNSGTGVFVSGDNAVITGDNVIHDDGGDGLVVYGSNVNITGLNIYNIGGAGIRLNDGNWGHATYTNATIINNTVTGSGSGIVVNCVNYATLSGNTATGNSGTGVYVSGDNVVITGDNVIHDNGGDGLVVYGSNVNITGLNIYNITGTGIRLNDGNWGHATYTNATIINNTVTGSGNGILVNWVVDSTVSGNTATGNSGTGVFVSGDYANVSRNTATGNTGNGIEVHSSNAIITSDNVIHDDGGDGLVVYGSNIVLTGLNIYNVTGSGIRLNDGNWGHATYSNVTITNSTITGSGNGIVVNWVHDVTLSGNTATGNSGTGVFVSGDNAVITGDNVIHDNGGDGLVVYGSNVNITGLNIYNIGGAGIRLNDGNWGHATYTNATIINNTVTGSGSGIVVNCVNYATLSGNTATGNSGTGVYVSGDYSNVSKNSVTGNTGEGIVIYGSLVQILENSVVNNSGTGIRLNDGNWGHGTHFNNTVANNTVTGNGNGILVNWNNDGIVSGNTVTGSRGTGVFASGYNMIISENNITGSGGEGIILYGNLMQILQNSIVNSTGNGIRSNDGGWGHATYSNITIANNTVDGNGNGIIMDYTNDVTLLGNAITGNKGMGIYVLGSNTIVSGNNVTGNNGYGMLISNGVDISDNTVNDNNGYGVSVTGAAVTVLRNTVNGNNGYGISVNKGTDISDNTVKNNTGYGISITSDGANVLRNIVSGNGGFGILINNGTNVSDNNVTSNGDYGISVTGNWVTVLRNIAAYNGGDGIDVVGNNAIITPDNNIHHNSGHGLHVVGSNIDLIGFNTDLGGFDIHHNGIDGICVSGNDYNISQNRITDNGVNGISVSGNNVTILSNIVTGNGANGILVTASAPVSGITISGNTVAWNNGDGINVVGDNAVITPDNNVNNNDGYGIHVIGDNIDLIGFRTSTGGFDIYNNGMDGIYVHGDNAQILQNSIISSGGNGIYISGLNAVVTGNIITDSDGNGIIVSGSATSVTWNTVTYNDGFGISVNTGENVSDNIVSHNGGYGISVTGSGVNVLRNTVTYNGGFGVSVNTGANVSYNVVTHNGGYGISVIGEGVHVLGNTAAYNMGGDGIYVLGNNAIITNDNNIHHNSGYGLYVIGNYITLDGFSTEHGGFDIHDNGLDGIYAPEDHVTITNSKITDNGGNGILVTKDHAVITGNIITNKGNLGISVVGDYATVTDNKVYNSVTDGISVIGRNAKVLRNIVSNSKGCGIWIVGNDAEVKENTVTLSKEDGIYVSGSSPDVSGNTISNCDGNGIVVSIPSSSMGGTVQGNNVDNCEIGGIQVNGFAISVLTNRVIGSGFGILSYGDAPVINNNNAFNNHGDGIMAYGYNAQVKWNTISGNWGDGINVPNSHATIEGNTVKSNGGDTTHGRGIAVGGDNAIIKGNTVQLNWLEGIVLNGNGATIIDNIVEDNGQQWPRNFPTVATTVKSEMAELKGNLGPIATTINMFIKDVVDHYYEMVRRELLVQRAAILLANSDAENVFRLSENYGKAVLKLELARNLLSNSISILQKGLQILTLASMPQAFENHANNLRNVYYGSVDDTLAVLMEGGCGILAFGDNINIIDNTITSNHGFGVSVFGDNPCIGNNRVYRNSAGIGLRGDHAVLEDNEVNDNNWMGIYINGGNNVVTNNHVNGNKAIGFYVEGNLNGIAHNEICNNGMDGMVNYGQNSAIGNRISGNGANGVFNVGASILANYGGGNGMFGIFGAIPLLHEGDFTSGTLGTTMAPISIYGSLRSLAIKYPKLAPYLTGASYFSQWSNDIMGLVTSFAWS